MLIDELVGFSNFYGSDPSLVLAGGGNTSAKADGRMWVKGSGTALATITAQGFVEIDLSKLGEIFEKSYPDSDSEREALVLQDLMASRVPGETKRPSVETTLHALFPQTYVLHLHPAKVNGITCSKGGESAARRVIDRDFIWIEQCRPGYVLAKLCRDKMLEFKARAGKDCDMLLLENHGIFVAADTADALGEKLSFVLDSIERSLSGGMQQRVGIVAAMLLNPKILMADEPTSALDVSVQKQVVDEMCMVREKFGTTILLVTHNLGVIRAMADKVLVLENGEVREYGKTKEVLENPQSEYTKKLLSAVLELRR